MWTVGWGHEDGRVYEERRGGVWVVVSAVSWCYARLEQIVHTIPCAK